MKKYLMKCGHVVNATDGNSKPVCAICLGNDDAKATEIDREVTGSEGLEGRSATCEMCNKQTQSRWGLPFFKYRPDKPTDSYYCGCMGWD